MLRWVLVLLLAGAATGQTARPNVVLICVDDLRPELGCYGAGHARTPRLDAFAETARVFTRHYVVVPTCGASRAALMTGLAPTSMSHLGNGAVAARREAMSLPRVLREAGYETATVGKVTHWPVDPLGSPDELDGAWSRVVRFDSAPWGDNKDAFFAYADGSVRERGVSPIAEAPDVDDEAYPDARIAAAAVEALGELAEGEAPFFLAVGFFKPHLPFNAPKRYWDLYDRALIPDAENPEKPEAADRGWRQSGEVTGNYGHAMWDDRVWDEGERAFMRHGYLACVSYVDAQIGRVLAAVDAIDEETIVVIWGDHGWHLGELGLMGKHTPYEEALRSPLIIRAPGMLDPGEPSDAIVSTLDVLPTVADLCGVEAPRTDGRSARAPVESPQARHRASASSWWRVGEHVCESVRTVDGRVLTWRRGMD